jgi:hypothetical protein
MWWAHEHLHRAVIRDYATRMPLYRAERDALEADFLRRAAALAEEHRGTNTPERVQALAALSADCFEQARQATTAWTEQVSAAPVRQRPSPLFSLAWRILARQANFPRK